MTNEQNDNRSVARDDAQRDGAGKHIIYKSRIVSPKVEKPNEKYLDDYTVITPFGHTERTLAMSDYSHHLESLWPDGIECSAELLAKYGEGAEVVEGKDYEIQTSETPGTGCEEVITTVLAVPVQSDVEVIQCKSGRFLAVKDNTVANGDTKEEVIENLREMERVIVQSDEGDVWKDVERTVSMSLGISKHQCGTLIAYLKSQYKLTKR